MAFLSRQELSALGFKSLGEDVRISSKASIHGSSRISIGNHVRIDDFCILSSGEHGIEIGDYVHVACYTSLIGKEKIRLHDFVNISSRVAIYSSSDDYSGEWMTNPMVPVEFTRVDHRPVCIKKHCILGTGSVVLPGVTLGEGCAIGALSLVNKDCDAFGIYGGIPAKFIKSRKRGILSLADRLRSNER